MMFINKERKSTYYVSKITFSDYMREKLSNLVERLAIIKSNMQKTPITLEEDLHKLEAESERDITLIMLELESFFEPVTQQLDLLINPPIKVAQEEEEA
jgi:hypothetical protein